MPSPNGTVVMTGRPELISEVYRGDPMNYEVFAPELIATLLSEGSLLTSTGERHRRDRKLLGAPFHGRHLDKYANDFQTITLRHMEAIAPGEVFVGQQLAQRRGRHRPVVHPAHGRP